MAVCKHSVRLVTFVRGSVAVAVTAAITFSMNGGARLQARAVLEKPKPVVGDFGFDVVGMDRSVLPGDDFVRFATGRWIDSIQIPAERSSVSSLTGIKSTVATRVRGLIEQAAKLDGLAGTDAHKIGDYFKSFMDEACIENLGANPIRPELNAIARIRSHSDLSAALGAQVRSDVDILNLGVFHTPRLFGLWVAESLDDATRYRPYLIQGGLGMPDREYYLGTNPHYVELRAKYQDHIAVTLHLAGYTNPAARAAAVMMLETEIAKAHVSIADTINVSKGNTVWKRSDLPTKAPGLDWPAFLAGAGLQTQLRFGAWQPSALARISALTASKPLEMWKDYLAFHAIDDAAPFLSKAFSEEAFAFNDRAVYGTQQAPDRWRRGVDETSTALGQAIGKLYVEKYFPRRRRRRRK